MTDLVLATYASAVIDLPGGGTVNLVPASIVARRLLNPRRKA